MARRRGAATKAQQVFGRDFVQQSEGKANFSQQAARATDAESGNTGQPAIASMYKAKKQTKSAGGAATNFARRGNIPQKVKRDPAQKPAISTRQYGQATLAAMPQ